MEETREGGWAGGPNQGDIDIQKHSCYCRITSTVLTLPSFPPFPPSLSQGLLTAQGLKTAGPLPPHVYSIADAAYRAMMEVRREGGKAGERDAEVLSHENNDIFKLSLPPSLLFHSRPSAPNPPPAATAPAAATAAAVVVNRSSFRERVGLARQRAPSTS